MSATSRTVIWKRPLEDAQVSNSDNKRIKWAITNYILHRYCKEQGLWMQSSGDMGNSSNERGSSTIGRFETTNDGYDELHQSTHTEFHISLRTCNCKSIKIRYK